MLFDGLMVQPPQLMHESTESKVDIVPRHHRPSQLKTQAHPRKFPSACSNTELKRAKSEQYLPKVAGCKPVTEGGGNGDRNMLGTIIDMYPSRPGEPRTS